MDDRVARFMAKTVRHGACLLWTGDMTANIRVGTRQVRPHRFAYEAIHGPLEKRQRLHRRCGNPKCVEPGHYYTTPPTGPARLRCVKGHLFVPENTYAQVVGDRTIYSCRACRRARNRARN